MFESDPPLDGVAVKRTTPEEYVRDVITVDYLYLDGDRCERCVETGGALREALELVAPVVDELAVEIEVRDVEVPEESAIRETGLAISPTIRIDGADIQPDYVASQCESGGDGCRHGDGTLIDCREWRYDGRTSTSVPVPLVVNALLRALADRPSARVEPHSNTPRQSPLFDAFDIGPDRSSVPAADTAPVDDCC